MRRAERIYNVKKITRQQEFEKQEMMKEINEQTLKAQMMKIQKDELLKKRKMIKAQA